MAMESYLQGAREQAVALRELSSAQRRVESGLEGALKELAQQGKSLQLLLELVEGTMPTSDVHSLLSTLERKLLAQLASQLKPLTRAEPAACAEKLDQVRIDVDLLTHQLDRAKLEWREQSSQARVAQSETQSQLETAVKQLRVATMDNQAAVDRDVSERWARCEAKVEMLAERAAQSERAFGSELRALRADAENLRAAAQQREEDAARAAEWGESVSHCRREILRIEGRVGALPPPQALEQAMAQCRLTLRETMAQLEARCNQIATQAVAAAAPSPTEQLASTQALERLREQVEGSLPRLREVQAEQQVSLGEALVEMRACFRQRDEALAPRLASLRSEVAEEVARRSATMERRLAAAEEVYAARLAKLQRANAEELEAAERKAVAWQASCTAAVEMTVQRLGDDLSQQLERAENDLSELRTENQGSRAKAEDACAVLSTRLEQLETTLSATSAEVEDALRRAPERRQLLEERIDVQQREAEREAETVRQKLAASQKGAESLRAALQQHAAEVANRLEVRLSEERGALLNRLHQCELKLGDELQAVGRAAQQQLGSNFRQLQEANQSAVRLIAELSSQQQDRLETSRAEQMEVARRTAAVQDAARADLATHLKSLEEAMADSRRTSSAIEATTSARSMAMLEEARAHGEEAIRASREACCEMREELARVLQEQSEASSAQREKAAKQRAHQAAHSAVEQAKEREWISGGLAALRAQWGAALEAERVRNTDIVGRLREELLGTQNAIEDVAKQLRAKATQTTLEHETEVLRQALRQAVRRQEDAMQEQRRAQAEAEVMVDDRLRKLARELEAKVLAREEALRSALKELGLLQSEAEERGAVAHGILRSELDKELQQLDGRLSASNDESTAALRELCDLLESEVVALRKEARTAESESAAALAKCEKNGLVRATEGIASLAALRDTTEDQLAAGLAALDERLQQQMDVKWLELGERVANCATIEYVAKEASRINDCSSKSYVESQFVVLRLGMRELEAELVELDQQLNELEDGSELEERMIRLEEELIDLSVDGQLVKTMLLVQ